MVEIGFSTNSFAKLRLTLKKQIEFCRTVKLSALEVVFQITQDVGQRFDYSHLKGLDLVALHAPYKGMLYKRDDGLTRRVLQDLERKYELLAEQGIDVRGVVFHPDLIDDYSLLENLGFKVLIENMGQGKKSGYDAPYFDQLKTDYGVGFVLDLFHAWERDPSLGLVRELVDVMGDRLSHFHISGNIEENRHCLLHLSDNREQMGGILRDHPCVPRILEGVLQGDVAQVAQAELEYVRGIHNFSKTRESGESI